MILEFTDDHLRVIDAALQQLPYYQSAPVINEINRQIAAKAEADERPE